MLAGAIEIQMLADLARLKDDTGKAVGLVETASRKMQDVAGLAGKALGMIGVGLSAGAFVGWIKGAIDSADAFDEMSGRVNVSAKSLSELSLAYQLNGMDNAAMQSSLAKLSKQIVDGGGAFDTLGVKTRNADGSVREALPVLYDLADAFANAEGKVEKVALAQEIFGKSGADMLPLLNGGSAGLREMADQAARLGLVIEDETAANAAKFNDTLDLLGSGLKGVAMQTAAQLQPTLSMLAGSFLESATSGDNLKTAADAIAITLKVVASAAAGVVGLIAAAGKGFVGLAETAWNLAQGKFSKAAESLQRGGVGIRDSIAESAVFVAKVWNDSGNKTVDSLTSVAGAQRKLATQSKAEADESKKLASEKAAAAKKEQEDYTKLVDKIRERTAAVQQETLMGRALTESEKLGAEVTAKYTGSKRDQALAEVAALKAAEDHKRAQEDLRKTLADVAAHTTKMTAAQGDRTESLRAQVVADQAANRELQQQIELTGLSGQALLEARKAVAAREAAVLRATAADLEWQAGMEGGNRELEEQARLLRERAKLGEDRALLDAQKAYKDEWVQTNQQIGQSLTDALMQGGKSAREYLVGLFRATVLKPIVQAVMAPVTGAISSLLMGGSAMAAGAAGGAGSAGGAGGLLGLAGGLFGAGGLTGSLMAGAGWLTGATSFTGALGAAGSLVATGTAGGLLSGLGMAIGALGPIALGIGLVAKLFGGGGTPHRGAQALTDETGRSYVPQDRLVGGYAWGDSVHKNRSQEVEDTLMALTKGYAGQLNALSQVFGGGKYQVGAYFAADNDDASQANFKIWRDGQQAAFIERLYDKDPTKGYQEFLGDTAGAVRQVLSQMAMPTWARDMVASSGSDASALSATIATIQQTQAGLVAMSTALSPLGGVFSRIGSLSSDAQYQLAQFAGGIESLAAKAQDYAKNYYSEAEQIGLSAQAVKSALVAAGLDGATLSERADLRALLESRDITTEAGRKQIAALLEVQGSFAQIADYIKANGGTLDSLAAGAPGVQLLQAQVDHQAAQIDAAQQTVQAINTVNTSILGVQGAVQALQSGMQLMLDKVANSSESSARYIADSLGAFVAAAKP